MLVIRSYVYRTLAENFVSVYYAMYRQLSKTATSYFNTIQIIQNYLHSRVWVAPDLYTDLQRSFFGIEPKMFDQYLIPYFYIFLLIMLKCL